MADQTQERAPAPERPVLALRVGVTGHRRTEELGDVAALSHAVAGALDTVRAAVGKIAATPLARQVYRCERDSVVTAYRACSPLAEGADRLFAEAALHAGFALLAPLPFAREDYANDFASEESRAAFAAMLGKAQVVELDGARAAAGPQAAQIEDRSYDAVGRFMVRNSDLLVAIWNGTPAKGIGGTALIVDAALRQNVAVLWLSPERAERPILLRSRIDLDHASTQAGEEALAASFADSLRDYLHGILLPREGDGHEPPGGLLPGWHHAEHWLFGPGEPGSRIAAFYAERPSKLRFFDHWQNRLRNAIDRTSERIRARRGTRQPAALESPALPAPEPTASPAPAVTEWFERVFMAPDQLADRCVRRYRLGFLVLFALSAVAASCAVGALAVPAAKTVLTIIELIALVAIAAIVKTANWRRWHDRWIDYRLLAELLRQSKYLALLGRAISIARAAELAARSAAARGWVIWYFDALTRAAPVIQGRFDAAYLDAVQRYVAFDLLDGHPEHAQIPYHRLTGRRFWHSTDTVTQFASLLFALTIVLVALKLAAIGLHWDLAVFALGLVAGMAPAFAAALFAIRAQGELDLVQKTGERMVEELTRASHRLAALGALRARLIAEHGAAPLASEPLGEEIARISRLMLAELEDWAILFDLKAIEAA